MKLLNQNQFHQDLALPSYPPRSRLFCIEPVGIGTQLTESLLSYLTRLSIEHCLLPGVLMEREIIPTIIDRAYASGNSHRIYEAAPAFNGTGKMAASLVDALERSTRRRNLRFLTFLSWSELLPSRKLLRSYRAWCSFCYQEWYELGQEVIEPLIWALQVVQVCPYHFQVLQQVCPHCCERNLPLTSQSRPGYCSKCLQWLGGKNCCSEALSDNKFNWLVWVAKAAGELVAATPNLNYFPGKEHVSKLIKTYVYLTANGNIAEFARQVQMPRNTVWLWCEGKNQPQFEALLKICYCLNISLLEFLLKAPTDDKHLTIRTLLLSSLPSSRAKAKKINLQQLEQELQTSLLNHECPPPSMEEVARQLGYDYRTISRLFPELCSAISTRYLSYRKALRLRAIEQCCQEVRQAVVELHNQGLTPSEGSVAKLVTRPGYLRRKSVREALKQARDELGC